MTPSLTKADTHKQRHSEDAHQIVKFHLIWWTTEKKRERERNVHVIYVKIGQNLWEEYGENVRNLNWKHASPKDPEELVLGSKYV